MKHPQIQHIKQVESSERNRGITPPLWDLSGYKVEVDEEQQLQEAVYSEEDGDGLDILLDDGVSSQTVVEGLVEPFVHLVYLLAAREVDMDQTELLKQ